MKLRDGPCGRPHFAIVDPNGIVLDFVGPARTAARLEHRPVDRLQTLLSPAVPYPRTVQPGVAG